MTTANITSYTQCKVEIFGKVRLNVSTYIVTTIIEVINITILSQVTQRSEITHLFITTLYRYTVFLGETCTKYFINIIYVVPAICRITIGHGFHIFFCKMRHVLATVGNSATGQLVHHLCHIIIVCKLRAIHEFGEIGIHRSTKRCIISHFSLTGFTLFGSYDDNTTGTLQTIYSSRSTILQNRYAFNVVRVKVIDIVYRETIDNVSYIIDRTTNLQRSLVQARFS